MSAVDATCNGIPLSAGCGQWECVAVGAEQGAESPIRYVVSPSFVFRESDLSTGSTGITGKESIVHIWMHACIHLLLVWNEMSCAAHLSHDRKDNTALFLQCSPARKLDLYKRCCASVLVLYSNKA